MIDPMTLMMLAQAAPQVMQMAGGLMQAGSGLVGLSKDRPKYSIPTALRQSVAMAQLSAGQNAPGYELQRMQNAQMMANATQASQGAGNITAAMAIFQNQANQANMQLRQQNQQFIVGQQQNMYAQLDRLASTQDQQWQMNEFAPYADSQRRSMDMLGAGLSNIYGASTQIGGVAQAGKSYADAIYKENRLEGMSKVQRNIAVSKLNPMQKVLVNMFHPYQDPVDQETPFVPTMPDVNKLNYQQYMPVLATDFGGGDYYNNNRYYDGESMFSE
jgi:hypothetical protein